MRFWVEKVRKQHHAPPMNSTLTVHVPGELSAWPFYPTARSGQI
jgi:hypothetical protein